MQIGRMRHLLCVALSVLLPLLAVAACECGKDEKDCSCHEGHEATVHKALLPLDVYDKTGFFLMGSMTAIAAGGGIGGGGVLVPILILVMGFTIKAAIPLSSATIFGGSIFHIVRNLMRRHPTADRPLIDWNFITLMQPMLIAGAVLGSFLNKLVPDWVLAVLLFIILTMTAHRTYNNAMKKWRKEHEEIELRESLAASGMEMEEAANSQPLLEPSPELTQLLEEDKHFPFFKVSVVLMVFFGVVGLNVAKGSEAAGFMPFGVKCGSDAFWALSLAVIPWCFICWYIVRKIIVNQYHARIAANWEFHDGDVQWDESRTIHYPLISIGAGLIAGMFGIGGGIINGPLMVELGFKPEVAAATGATMLLFTSTTSVIMYSLFDMFNYEYAVVVVPLGFVCTIIGQLGFNRIMHHYKRDSLIVFVIAFIVAASAVLMGIEGSYTFIDFWNGHAHPITGICGALPMHDELTLDPNIHNRRAIWASMYGGAFRGE